MKVRRIAGLVGVVVAASMSFAQDVSPDINTGSKALLFTFSGLDGLGAGAYNAGIGGKYYLMEPIALRASLALSTSSEDDPTGAFGSSSGMMFGISAGGEYHLSFNRVSPYVGGEIGFSTVSTKIIDSVTVPAAAKRTQKNVDDALDYTPGKSLTIGGLGGVEFFITKEISLGAEYTLGWSLPLGYKAKTITEGTVKDERTVDVPGRSDFGIYNNGALTLAVYF
jgi:opacity protein-like surface antigen